MLGASLITFAAFPYDLHTKALTPIVEEPAPKGAPVALVRGGAPEVAVVFDRCDAWGCELDMITNAFARCTGHLPAVYKAAQSNECLKAKACCSTRRAGSSGTNYEPPFCEMPR